MSAQQQQPLLRLLGYRCPTTHDLNQGGMRGDVVVLVMAMAVMVEVVVMVVMVLVVAFAMEYWILR
ncbi:hypothetical protein E2C01_063109 [Portunus trituberculatus]|uniref:Uncharacterized protein n=1 Tax=Portunus trituberculatus TaxID=210409 RepID=A0A5B7HJE0_PORTR|nr:hypothetical protein [Portunus trituberculatus]